MEEYECDEAFFGDENLQLIGSEAVKSHPHNCVGVIHAWHEGKMLKGTGFLLASSLVLTVAHNVVSRQGVQYTNIAFYPGVSGDLTPNNGYKVIDRRFPREYQQEVNNETYDYALLKIEGQVKVKGDQYIELGVNYVKQK